MKTPCGEMLFATRGNENSTRGEGFAHEGGMKKDLTKKAQQIREQVAVALGNRHAASRESAVAAFAATGVPELFQDADLVLKELKDIRRYVLTGCPDGIPRLQLFTVTLIKRMLTAFASFRYEAWVMKTMTDGEVVALGDFRDDDSYLAKFCFDDGNGQLVENRKEHVLQRKVQKALAEYVKVAAAHAKELKAGKAVNLWLRAYEILILHNSKVQAPYLLADLEKAFAYVDEAATETYVAWMSLQLPTLAQLRKETKA